MKKIKLQVIGTLLLLIASCTKEDPNTLPTVVSKEITDIFETSAVSGGLVVDDGNDFIFERGVCWSSNTLEPTISDSKTNNGQGNEEFLSKMENLLSNTTYYMRAYATNNVGTAYGSTKLFKTNAALPSVKTSMVSQITQNSIKCGGLITAQNNLIITARGVCWGVEPMPNLSGNKTLDGTGQGEFVSNVTGLDANTSYYIRAYATNTDGITTYGTDFVFKTKADLPILTTDDVNSITQTSAICGGNVISNGGVSIVSKGVCWSTDTLPEITNSRTNETGGLGVFTSDISGLLANTVYYLRAYATNSEGETAYGNEQMFTTLSESITYPSTSTYGQNILNDNTNIIDAKTSYSFAAILPIDTNLTIKMSGGLWSYDISSNSNWNISSFNFSNNSQTFASNSNDNLCDLKIEFETGLITIEYFENGSSTATKTKQLNVQ